MERFIVGIGDALWDCLPEGRKLGGAPANFAYYMTQFGYESLAVSAIGKDSLGAEIKAEFDRMGLKSILQINDHDTGTVAIDINENGIPTYDIRSNVAYDHLEFTPELKDIAVKCNVACFGSMTQRNPLSRMTIRRFIEAMPEDKEVYKVFDINLRQDFYSKEVISESLKLCNVFKLNDEELVIVKDMFGYAEVSDHDACINIVKDWDLKFLILTCGVNGSHVFTVDEYSFMPTPKVEEEIIG